MNYTYSKMAVGKRIRDYRISHDYTQIQFAEKLDISVNFLSEIENGHKGVSMDMLAKVCETLDLSADYIMFGKEDEPEEISMPDITEQLNSMTTEQLSAINSYITALMKVREIPRLKYKR